MIFQPRDGRFFGLRDLRQRFLGHARLFAGLPQHHAAYEHWWEKVEPLLVNEQAYQTAPLLNPFAVLYWKQFGGGPIPGKAGEGSNQRYESGKQKSAKSANRADE